MMEHRSSTTDSTPLTMPRILIVEDNPDLAYGLRTGLEIEGYDVQVSLKMERPDSSALAPGVPISSCST